MKHLLYPILAIFALSVVCVDHFTVGLYLSEFQEARQYNEAEMNQAFQLQDTVFSNQMAQETLLIVTRQYEQLVLKLDRYRADIMSLNDANERLQSVLEATSNNVLELTEDNAELSKINDRRELEVEFLSSEREKLLREVKQLKNEIEQLKKKVENENSPV